MNPHGWETYRLMDVAFFQEGPGLRNWQWTPDGMKVINGTNILLSGQIDTANTDKFISNVEFESKYKHFEIDEGDLVLTSSGTLGKVGKIRSDHLPLMMNTSVIRFRSKNQKALDDGYLHCYLRSPEFQGKIRSFAVGGAQQNFGPTHLKQITLPLPSIARQQQVSGTIAAYDDLIENNRRRITLLEEAARLLYREWFVHLHFPGHEHVKIVDGVPEGWELCTAFDVMEVLSGGTPKTNVPDYWDGEIPFFTPKDAVDAPYVLDTEKSVTALGLRACNSRLYPKDTLFITARGTVGNLNLSQSPMAMNQSCYALQGKGYLSQFYLYCALNEAVMQFKSRAGGAVFDAIVVNTFKLIPFVRPPETLVAEFTDVAAPMFQQIDRLLLQSKKLREARDLLLPRLMSGEIAI